MVAAPEVRDPRAAARDSAGAMVAVLEARGPGAQAVLGSVATRAPISSFRSDFDRLREGIDAGLAM